MSLQALKSAMAERNTTAERVKTELRAVAGTDVSRVALDGYRQQYASAAGHFEDLVVRHAEALIECAELAKKAMDLRNNGDPTGIMGRTFYELTAALARLEK